MAQQSGVIWLGQVTAFGQVGSQPFIYRYPQVDFPERVYVGPKSALTCCEWNFSLKETGQTLHPKSPWQWELLPITLATN
jgi:hypothetical protein